jgi:hypothetical protein
MLGCCIVASGRPNERLDDGRTGQRPSDCSVTSKDADSAPQQQIQQIRRSSDADTGSASDRLSGCLLSSPKAVLIAA